MGGGRILSLFWVRIKQKKIVTIELKLGRGRVVCQHPMVTKYETACFQMKALS